MGKFDKRDKRKKIAVSHQHICRSTKESKGKKGTTFDLLILSISLQRFRQDIE